MSRFTLYLSLLAIVPISTSTSVTAQISVPVSIEVHGQVRYANGNRPAEHILVRIERLSGGIIAEELTDRSGKFRFTGLSQTQYVVTVHQQGFEDAQQQVDLQTTTSEYVLPQLVPARALASELPSVPLIDANVPAEARTEYEKGRNSLIREQKTNEGLSHLEKAVQLYPNFYEAQLLLGTGYMDQGKWERAESSLRFAIEANPKSSEAFFALGEVYMKQKRYDDAERAFKEGLGLNNRSAQGHLNLGRIYWEKKEIAKAGPEVGRAIQLKPDLAEAHLLAGNILLRARQPENALTEFEEYLRLAPDGEFAKPASQIIQKIEQALAEKKR